MRRAEQAVLLGAGTGEGVRAQSRALIIDLHHRLGGEGGMGAGKERELHQGLMYIKGPYHQNTAFLILAILRQTCLPFLHF